jgi:hypothetical protein
LPSLARKWNRERERDRERNKVLTCRQTMHTWRLQDRLVLIWRKPRITQRNSSSSAGKMTGTGGDNMNGPVHSSSGLIHIPVVRITVLFLGVLAVSCLVLYKSANPFEFLPQSLGSSSDSDSLSVLYHQTYKVCFPFIIS